MNQDQEVLNELLALARTNNRNLDSNSREVLKKKKSKKENYSSREDEELKGFDFVTSCLAAANSIGEGQEAVDSIVPAAITSSRSITGITAQHVKTPRGIKVSLSIQTPQDRPTGEFTSLTAELKRHGRLRELKRYAGDSAAFEEHYMATIQELKSLTPEEGRTICCGRIHQRGKRAAWFGDMMVVGRLDESGTHLDSIILYYGLEEYLIEMNEPLTERQAVGYHRSGIYGEIKTVATVPTLMTAPRRTM
jgi:hypothetical protein